MTDKKSCYIICGGPESCNNVKIPENAFIICADSGYDKALRAGIKPDIILGDFDSVEAQLPFDSEIIKAPPNKDDTDTLLAVKVAMLRGYTDITLVSALSGRTDHSIANISVLIYIAENNCKGRIIGDENDAYYILNTSLTLRPDISRYLSVFAVTENAMVSIKGAEYPLDRYKLKRFFPLGVSNEFAGTECKVTVHDGAVIVMTVKK